MTTPGKFNESDLPEAPAGPLYERLLWNQPFDKNAFRNNPNPRIFDPEQVVRASEPFHVDEFINW